MRSELLALHSELLGLRWVVRQLLGHFLCPCLSQSGSGGRRDHRPLLCTALSSARPNFAPPFASDRALSVLTARRATGI